jgi:UDP-N-acetylmuramate--alanine ligase
LIGIGGAGMRALADVLLGMGWRLSGSDLALDAAGGLAAAGVRLFSGHAAAHLPPETEIVVFSSAIPPQNPELRRAAELGIPCVSYFQMLGRLMSGRHGLAVAGTHGKSTTTAMAAEILVAAGSDPTVVLGAVPIGAASGGRAGQRVVMLVEACEYQANFLHLRPRHAVILGIEHDHFDCYDRLAQVEAAFTQFAALIPHDGLLLVPYDCPAARRAAGITEGDSPIFVERKLGQSPTYSACRVETFGFSAAADWSVDDVSAEHGRYAFQIRYRSQPIGRVRLRVPGRHNVTNALAAAALAFANGAPAEEITKCLAGFRGLHRRLEILGNVQGVTLVDDYAHHPTEIAASLATLRSMFPGRRVWCVFQPHQASRTERLLDDLAETLQNAERVLVAEVFRAREPPPRKGDVAASDLAREVRARGGEVAPLHSPAEILQFLETQLVPGDVLVTMGAGDVGKISYGLMERFREDRAAG